MGSQASTQAAVPVGPLPTTRSRGGSQARGRAIALAIDLKALRAAYEAGASTVDLALEHGISRTTIRELLIDMGCELRGTHSAARVREMPSWLRLEMPTPVDDKRFVDDVEGTCWRPGMRLWLASERYLRLGYRDDPWEAPSTSIGRNRSGQTGRQTTTSPTTTRPIRA